MVFPSLEPTRTVPAITNPRSREIATFGTVQLEVTDLRRSATFFHDVLGLHVRAETADMIELGTVDATLVTLHGGASHPFLQRHSGLYHLAIHPPSVSEFGRMLQRLLRARWRFSPVDHIMSKAIYLLDPDGITIEITLETPERLRELVADDHGVQAIRVDGTRASGRDPFDLAEALDGIDDHDLDTGVPSGTRIGHVHLYVGNLEEAYRFYGSLGFSKALWAPSLHVGDLGAGGAFNHRIAVNTWQGVGAPQSPHGTARMRNFTIRLDTHERLDAVLGHLSHDAAETEGGYILVDPSGNRLELTSA